MIADEENGAPAAPEIEAETPPAETEPQPAAETEEGEKHESEQAEDPTAKALKKMQRSIDRLVRDKHELREKFERATQQGDQKPAVLDRSMFDSEDDYIEARIQQRIEAEKAQERQKSFAQRVDTILKEAESLGDFDREDFAEISITPDMADAIVESDVATKLVRYFHNDPEEAERISKLSPARQTAEIGKLEDRLSEAKPKPAKSSAPEPIKPVAGSGKSSTGYRPDMSMAEYAKWRKAQR